jgi:hypothetical protein
LNSDYLSHCLQFLGKEALFFRAPTGHIIASIHALGKRHFCYF